MKVARSNNNIKHGMVFWDSFYEIAILWSSTRTFQNSSWIFTGIYNSFNFYSHKKEETWLSKYYAVSSSNAYHSESSESGKEYAHLILHSTKKNKMSFCIYIPKEGANAYLFCSNNKIGWWCKCTRATETQQPHAQLFKATWSNNCCHQNAFEQDIPSLISSILRSTFDQISCVCGELY